MNHSTARGGKPPSRKGQRPIETPEIRGRLEDLEKAIRRDEALRQVLADIPDDDARTQRLLRYASCDRDLADVILDVFDDPPRRVRFVELIRRVAHGDGPVGEAERILRDGP